MSAHKKQQVNLLPEKGFTSTTTGRVLTWILSTFRIIVIVTEIIVMIAFLSRFWLDAQNTDLSEERIHSECSRFVGNNGHDLLTHLRVP